MVKILAKLNSGILTFGTFKFSPAIRYDVAKPRTAELLRCVMILLHTGCVRSRAGSARSLPLPTPPIKSRARHRRLTVHRSKDST